MECFCEKNVGEVAAKDWSQELAATRVSYEGEEVSTARVMTLEQLEPALPPAGVAASIEAVDLVEGEMKKVLLDPNLVKLPRSQRPRLKRPGRIWATREEWFRIVKLLFALGIVAPLADEEIWRVGGEPVLNGSFGVEKAHDDWIELHGQLVPLLRLIMNLINSNSQQRPLFGDIDTLPSNLQWSMASLLAFEVLL